MPDWETCPICHYKYSLHWYNRCPQCGSLADALSEWLGDEGKEFFAKIFEHYGKLNVVIPDRILPHPVHFREGMAIRNRLRELTNYKYDAVWYDAMWEPLTLMACGIGEKA